MPTHPLWQVRVGAMLLGITVFTWWAVLAGRMPREERGWVWGTSSAAMLGAALVRAWQLR